MPSPVPMTMPHLQVNHHLEAVPRAIVRMFTSQVDPDDVCMDADVTLFLTEMLRWDFF